MITTLNKRQATLYRKDLKKSPCLKELGTGTQATTYKVCETKDCKNCHVTKMGSTDEAVTASEGLVMAQISQAIKSQDPQFTHIQQFRKMLVLPADRNVIDAVLDRPVQLESEQVPTVMDMQQWVTSSRSQNREQLMTQLTQIFATLAHISEKVPGFLHMDIKPANVAMRPWPLAGSEKLTVDGHRIVLHKQPLWPVIIDFGTSRTTKYPTDSTQGAFSEWLGACYFEGFDVFRMLVTIAKQLPKSHTDELHAVHSVLEKFWSTLKETNVRQLKRLVKNRNFYDKASFVLLGRACKQFSIDFPTQAQAAMLCQANLQRPTKVREFFLL